MATVSLAANMNDSIIRSDKPRSRNSMSVGLPVSSTIIFASGASNSIAPRSVRLAAKALCNCSISSNIGTRSLYSERVSSSPAKIALTALYVIRACERITEVCKRWFTKSPAGVNSISADMAKRSTPGFNDAIPLEMLRGNIGMTRSVK